MSAIISNFARFGVTENVQRAKSILKKQNIDPSDQDYAVIRAMLANKMGWVGMFTFLRFEATPAVSIDDLAQLFDKLMSVEPMLKNLPKTVDQYDSYESLTDALDVLILKRLVTRFYQELLAPQKTGFKEMDEEQRDRLELILPLFYDKITPNVQKEFLLYIKQYKTFPVLLDALELHVESNIAAFTMPQVREMVEQTNGGAKIVYVNEKKQRMVVRLLTFSASQLLNASTQWCIRNGESNWNGYVNERSYQCQYTVYNFTKRYSDITSMIAITVGDSGNIEEAAYKNNQHITEKEVMRVAKSQGFADVLRPVEGEEREKREAAHEFMRQLAYLESREELPAYIETFKKGLETHNPDATSLGKVLRIGIRFDAEELVKDVLALNFLPKLNPTDSAALMNYCLMTQDASIWSAPDEDDEADRTKYMDMLLKGGLTLTPLSGDTNYSRYMLIAGKEAELQAAIMERGLDYQSMTRVLSGGSVKLWAWFLSEFKKAAPRIMDHYPEGTISFEKILAERIYTVIGNTNNSQMTGVLKHTTFELLEAISPYLTNLKLNRGIFCTFYTLHQKDKRAVELLSRMYPKRKEDVLGADIPLYRFKDNMYDYVQLVINAGFANVSPQIAARMLGHGNPQMWEAIMSRAERRNTNSVMDKNNWQQWEINPSFWLGALLTNACLHNAFEGVKWLHQRGFKLDGKVVHNFATLMQDEYSSELAFQDRYNQEYEFNAQFVYYMYRLGYPIRQEDGDIAFAEVEPDAEDIAKLAPTEFLNVIKNKIKKSTTPEDYAAVVALVKEKYPENVPLEFLKIYEDIAPYRALVHALLGNGRIDVTAFEKGKWTTEVGTLIAKTHKDPKFYKSIRGLQQVEELDALYAVGGILRHIEQQPTKPGVTCLGYMLSQVRRNGVISDQNQLGIYSAVRKGIDPVIIKQLMGTSEEVALIAVIQSAHMWGASLEHLNTLAFAGRFTLGTMRVLVENLRYQAMFNKSNTHPTNIPLDKLRQIVKLRRVKGDYTSLLPLLEKRRGMIPEDVYDYMKKLLGGATNESYLIDFAGFTR